jgi:predicted  nucleic acid-binding Zn-ribbon protein
MKKAEVLDTLLASEKERAAAALKDVKRLADELAREQKLRAKAEENIKPLRDQLEELKKSYATAVGKAAALEADLAHEKERTDVAVKDAIRTTEAKWRMLTEELRASVKRLTDELKKSPVDVKGNTGVFDAKPPAPTPDPRKKSEDRARP